LGFDTVKRILDHLIVGGAIAIIVDGSSRVPQHNTSKGGISLVSGDQVICLSSTDVVTIILFCAGTSGRSSDQTDVQLSSTALAKSNGIFPSLVVQVN
jgi:hypothetical protein